MSDPSVNVYKIQNTYTESYMIEVSHRRVRNLICFSFGPSPPCIHMFYLSIFSIDRRRWDRASCLFELPYWMSVYISHATWFIDSVVLLATIGAAAYVSFFAHTSIHRTTHSESNGTVVSACVAHVFSSFYDYYSYNHYYVCGNSVE